MQIRKHYDLEHNTFNFLDTEVVICMILVLLKGTNSLSHYLTQQSKDFSEQASIDFQTTQETQHYSSTGAINSH
jgi:hypothetical protein